MRDKNIHFVTYDKATPFAMQLPVEYKELLKDALEHEEIEELEEALKRLHYDEDMFVQHEAVKYEYGL